MAPGATSCRDSRICNAHLPTADERAYLEEVLFLFVALGKHALLTQISPAAEVVLYALLSLPLMVAVLIYTNRVD